MLLDFTRRPLVLIPDECPASIIIRAATGDGTKGTVWMEASQEYRRQHRAEWVELAPTETFDRGNVTYVETRLPLNEVISTGLASIFEVASVSGKGAWRIRVIVACKPITKLWHVTVEDVTRAFEVLVDEPGKVELLMVTTKGLSAEWNTLWEEKVPLTRAKKTVGTESEMPANIWTRLISDD